MSDKQMLNNSRIGPYNWPRNRATSRQLASERTSTAATAMRSKRLTRSLQPKERRRPLMPNQKPPELEKQILHMTAKFPTYSYIRITDQLRLVGIGACAPAVSGAWARRGITLHLEGLLWLDNKTASESGVPT